jgi:putative tryptophan/tyrosine transport system substrate-binding protein
VRRRAFIAALGGAAAWPLAARAQQPAMPVIGYLSSSSPAAENPFVTAFMLGLKDSGFVDGQNVISNFAGQTVIMTACRHWRPIWFVDT